MKPALSSPKITKTRRTCAPRRVNKVVKTVNGMLLVGMRLRSGYVVDDPPSPPSTNVLYDVDLVDDEDDDVVPTTPVATPSATMAKLIYESRVKQTAMKSTGGCSRCGHCSLHDCYILQ